MVREVVELLAPQKGEVVVDATFGTGGHSRALQKAAHLRLIAIDADPRAEGVIEANFADLQGVLRKEGIKKIDKALFDLGWNSEQLSSGRGFSFLVDEPLNMSYGKRPASGFTAREIVNTWDEKVLADVLYGYGEERYARRIAKAIRVRREVQPIETTMELVEIIKDSVPAAYRHARLHPATRTFQALRIAVNDELGVLEKGITATWEHLACHGRLAVITFHSIEDRIVKRLFVAFSKKDGHLVIKKPVVATKAEVAQNLSARSAKLRVIEKICP
jgi:16S rRNA (cytosine1402-N4)-methyltransferase